VLVFDFDRDGKWDLSYWDNDFDGKWDSVGCASTPDGENRTITDTEYVTQVFRLASLRNSEGDWSRSRYGRVLESSAIFSSRNLGQVRASTGLPRTSRSSSRSRTLPVRSPLP